MTAPANDNLAGAILITGSSGTTTGTNVDATAETGEPDSPTNSVWWKWVAPTSGFTAFYTRGSSFDTVINIYSGGPSMGSLVLESGNDDYTFTPPDGAGRTSATFPLVTSGTTYYIQVYGYDSSETGSITLGWNPSVVPPLTAGAWPLHVVDPAGLIYRVGPGGNPDGGILRLVEADGTRWVQGSGGTTSGVSNGHTASFTIDDDISAGVYDPTDWSDDGADSLAAASDGKYVHWGPDGTVGSAPATGESTWLEATVAPVVTPPGATLDYANVSVGSPTPGTAAWMTVYDSSHAVLHGPATGVSWTTLDPGEIASVAAGVYVKLTAANDTFTVAPRTIDYVTSGIGWTADLTARPLSVVDSDGTVLTTLPMVPDY